MAIDVNEFGYKNVSPDDYFHFECSGCGDCCRNVKDCIMVESLDLYRLAKHLKMEISEVVLQYTNTGFLSRDFPILTLKTKQHMDTCIFLKNARCSVHAANPRACRTYPLGTGPENGKWIDFIVSKKQHHFTGQLRLVRDWMSEAMTAEDREFVVADCDNTGVLARLISRIDKKHEDSILKLMLLFKYVGYELDEDFMPQYKRNMEMLKQQLERLG